MALRDVIIDAFAETPAPDRHDVSVPTYDDEGTAAYFAGTTWRAHSPRALREHDSSLSFFTPPAFRYFLPAFMLAELDDPETADVIAEGILFHLHNDDRAGELLAAMNAREREAVALFFEECATRYDRQDYTRAAEYVRDKVE